MTTKNNDYMKTLNLKKVVDIVLNYSTFVLSGEVENKNNKKIICKFYSEYSICGAVSMVSDLIDQLVNVEFFGDY